MLSMRFIRPRTLWLRRAAFQIHLWLGLLLAIYVLVIALSGSILVFQQEIRSASLPHAAFDAGRICPVSTVLRMAEARSPGARLNSIAYPQQPTPWWALYFDSPQGKAQVLYADATTGEPIQLSHRLPIDWVENLHVYLLAGHSGFVVNCTMGIGLLVVAVTGAILWWPGVQHVRRALCVSIRGSWKRINYNLHNAVGIWTLGIVCWWGLTAVYFLFPTPVATAVNRISPLVTMRPPATRSVPHSANHLPIDLVVQNCRRSGSGQLSLLFLPDVPDGNLTLLLDRRQAGDFTHRDILVCDAQTALPLSIWHYGENQSPGDWLLWLVYPLHFGTVWGLGVKVVWAMFGASLASLSVSGFLMYWNRYLSKRIH